MSGGTFWEGGGGGEWAWVLVLVYPVYIERKSLTCVHSTVSTAICFLRKDLFPSIKSLVGHLQFFLREKHNLVRHLICLEFFPSGIISTVFFV